jgi:5-methylcytosine-specific restriction protein A
MFDPGLKPGNILTNEGITNIFGCSPQGGMRRSHKTNTLVLISNHDKLNNPYNDRWIGNIFHYTGMGMEGDQSLDFNQNKTLSNSRSEKDLEVFLFEVFESKKYTYVGEVELADKPYQEKQKDSNAKTRNVWIFPLKLKANNLPPAITKETLDDLISKRDNYVKQLSDEDLIERVKNSIDLPGERQVTAKQYERNPYVSELAKRRAKGICQLCKKEAPFKNKNGEPYLETHHIKPLSKAGTDTIDNTVALCPNCHRRLHVLNNKEDIMILQK